MIQTLHIWLKKGSVARQIGIAVFLIFLTMMAVNTYVVWQQSQAAMEKQVTAQVVQINQMYFDSLNTLMLAGTMDQREILRQKLLQESNIIDARVIRGQAVSQQFGAGFASEQAKDNIDQKALQGVPTIQVKQLGGQRVLSVAIPYKATSSNRGVNCLQCHDVPENTVNGAIRIDYSLAHSDAAIEDILWQTLIINSLVLCLGIALLAIYMHRNLTHGIREADRVAEAISQNNFDITMPAIRKDNLGRLMFSLLKMREALLQQFKSIKSHAEHERQDMQQQLQQQEKESNLVVAFEEGIVNIVQNLKKTSQKVGGSATLLSTISTELNQSTITVSSGTDQVFTQVSDTSQSSHDINQSFQEVNQRSQDAIQIS
ncbi:MAG: methyl-accepting chemotaxis protein, partial [Mariprofundaceae bacterium]|nr:methyl-accepting chemotaxis protein [Mariprofundaceae bacterium]